MNQPNETQHSPAHPTLGAGWRLDGDWWHGPERQLVHRTARIGADVVIGYGAWIGYDVRIGTCAEIGARAWIDDDAVIKTGVRIGARAEILANTRIPEDTDA